MRIYVEHRGYYDMGTKVYLVVESGDDRDSIPIEDILEHIDISALHDKLEEHKARLNRE